MTVNIHVLRNQEYNIPPEDRLPIVYTDPTGRKRIGTSVKMDVYRVEFVAPSVDHAIVDRGDHFALVEPDGITSKQILATGRYR